MTRLTIPRLTLQVQIIAVVMAGLFLFDTLEPALDRWVGQSAVRPDLKQAVERVRTLAGLVGHAPPEGRAAVLEMAGMAGWRLDLAARELAADFATAAPDDGLLDRFGARLLVPDDVLAPVGGWRTFLDGRRVMAVEVDDRTLLIADFASPQMQLREVTGPLPNYLLALVILCLLFAVFSGRVITRPLRRIAAAAAGADLTGGPEIFEERGSIEIVMLARALNRMRRRIVTMVESRTRMLRGISHDLRTPLTRIRLRADRVADPDLRMALLADVHRLEALLDESLAYLRDDHAHEAVERVDVASTLQTICSDFADIGHDIRFHGPNRLVARCRPLALGRAVANLCENATRFATRTDLTLTAGDGVFVIEVADDGPGIPQDQRARVLDPFFKLDNARRDGGTGFGLGLAIVAEVVLAHRGRLDLLDSPLHGLTVRLTIPTG